VSDELGPEPVLTKEPAAKPRSRLVYAIDIVLVRLRFIGLLIAVMLGTAYWDDVVAHVERWTHRASAHGPGGVTDVEYFCPMHPHIVRPEAGTCPICGMPLSKRKKGEKSGLPEGVLARVQFAPFRIAQGGIRTSPVEWRPLVREIDTVGTVDFDERSLARITARFPGRVESLSIDFTGRPVARGDALATLYSPDVFAAQSSLLSGLRELREAERSPTAGAGELERGRALVAAARSRLVRWGLWPEQVAQIEETGTATPTVQVLSPLSGVVTKKSVFIGDYVAEGTPLFDVADLATVWIKARVYEVDLGVVAAGQTLAATSTAFPGESFEGTVEFIDPVLDTATRTASLRASVPNPAGRLKPGMNVAAALRVPIASLEPFRSMVHPQSKDTATPERRIEYWCPMHPEVVRAEPGECDKCGGMKLARREITAGPAQGDVLAVPETAIVDTGKRKVAYVESSPGVFDAREVVLGPRSGAYFPVVSGLEPGMRVATAGSFLIDAETRLNPAAAGSYFGASGTPSTTHEGHGK
jgi:Cu(I)/Ag(I) efflux system membrane fusion protein